MKRAVLISLLCFHVLSIAGLQELTRLPVLVQHFFEHKNLDNSITFLQYLEEHYNDIPHTDDDEDRDKQLPFKASELAANSVVSLTLPPSSEIIPKKAFQLLARQKILINNHRTLHSAFSGKIWQPPKSFFS